jgi:hypothetical protein
MGIMRGERSLVKLESRSVVSQFEKQVDQRLGRKTQA